MGRVWLVRHGQASFGSEDYDRLSALGERQCHRLGALWRAQGKGFATVMRGTLRRHAQSLDAIAAGHDGVHATTAQALPGLNEYDSEALIHALNAAPLERVTNAQEAREHFRQLREALKRWMQGDLAPTGMPSFASFRQGIQDALQRAHAASRDGDVLVVSSGGPISVALAQVLQAPPDVAIALNMRLRNSAVTELASTSRGFDMVAFNAVPHLEDEPAMMTHA